MQMKKDPKYGLLHLLIMLVCLITVLAAGYFSWKNFQESKQISGISVGVFIGSIIFAALINFFWSTRKYRCPQCGDYITKQVEGLRVYYYCSVCDAKYDST